MRIVNELIAETIIDETTGEKITREVWVQTEEEDAPIVERPMVEVKAEFRAKRNLLISQVDIEINKLEDNGQDATVLRTYRQALRDCTKDWIIPDYPKVD